jgi:hypothetical protein
LASIIVPAENAREAVARPPLWLAGSDRAEA